MGLSDTTSATADLATVAYQTQGVLDSITTLVSGSATPLATEQFQYDNNLRPLKTTATWQSGSGNPTGTTIFSQTRSYDGVGNVVSLSTTQAAVAGQTGSGGSETQNFCYDEQNQLVWAGNSGTQPAAGNGTCGTGTLSSGLTGGSYSNRFVLTHLGQVLQAPLNGGSTQRQYLYCDSNHPHQLQGLYPVGSTCSSPGTASYTSSYDAWGNVRSRVYAGSTATLSYDPLDHFTEWNVSATNHEWYVYDATGQRVLRRSLTASGTNLTVYAFGSEEHTYTGTGTATGNTYYESLAGHLLGKSDGSTTQFFLTDALGSVLSTINATSSASVQGNQVYGPYGKQRYVAGTLGTSKGFTGQYYDGLTKLDYYGSRYYDPVAGMFLSADSVQGNWQGMNPYSYVNGNPETFADPTGHRVVGGTFGSPGDAGGGSLGPIAPPIIPPITASGANIGLTIPVSGPSHLNGMSQCGVSITVCGNNAVSFAGYGPGGVQVPVTGTVCFICSGSDSGSGNSSRKGNSNLLAAGDSKPTPVVIEALVEAETPAPQAVLDAAVETAFLQNAKFGGIGRKIPTMGAVIITDMEGGLIYKGGPFTGANDPTFSVPQEGHAEPQANGNAVNWISKNLLPDEYVAVHTITQNNPCSAYCSVQLEQGTWLSYLQDAAEARGGRVSQWVWWHRSDGVVKLVFPPLQ